jgi:hypothetical protein
MTEADDRATLGARAWRVARLPDMRERARAIAKLVRAYLRAHSPYDPRIGDDRREEDFCRYCQRPVLRILTASGRIALVDPRPRRMLVLGDDPYAFFADCYPVHLSTCPVRATERVRHEPE